MIAAVTESLATTRDELTEEIYKVKTQEARAMRRG